MSNDSGLPEGGKPVYVKNRLRMEYVVKKHIVCVLELCEGNVPQAAETMGMARSTLYRYVRKYKLIEVKK